MIDNLSSEHLLKRYSKRFYIFNTIAYAIGLIIVGLIDDYKDIYGFNEMIVIMIISICLSIYISSQFFKKEGRLFTENERKILVKKSVRFSWLLSIIPPIQLLGTLIYTKFADFSTFDRVGSILMILSSLIIYYFLQRIFINAGYTLANKILTSKKMINSLPTEQLLKRYARKYYLFYLLAYFFGMIVAVILTNTTNMHEINDTMVILVITMSLPIYISYRFFKKEGRFFTEDERKFMVKKSVRFSWLISMILPLLYVGILVTKNGFVPLKTAELVLIFTVSAIFISYFFQRSLINMGYKLGNKISTPKII